MMANGIHTDAAVSCKTQGYIPSDPALLNLESNLSLRYTSSGEMSSADKQSEDRLGSTPGIAETSLSVKVAFKKRSGYPLSHLM